MHLRVICPTTADVAKYLLRVYETCIEGFVPEAVIMSRALLDRSAKRACINLGEVFDPTKEPSLLSA